jgi:hypothetical protein
VLGRDRIVVPLHDFSVSQKKDADAVSGLDVQVLASLPCFVRPIKSDPTGDCNPHNCSSQRIIVGAEEWARGSVRYRLNQALTNHAHLPFRFRLSAQARRLNDRAHLRQECSTTFVGRALEYHIESDPSVLDRRVAL